MTTPAPSASALHTAANAIRMLAVDAVAAAKSGHQGMPMGMAEIAVALWSKHLRHNPANPHWPNRDRFVVSNGHGSMLPYSLLHLSGYDLSMDDIRKFRQLHSKTPGHPEVGITAGIETTTGPLGRGIANAVGMALAEKLLNKRYGDVIDHRTYVFLGDGCMMEGVSHEACSLAGVWGLNKLVAFYDDNGISIDGEVQGWFRDNTAERFRAYGWHVIGPIDGHSIPAVDAAIETAKKETSKPVLIICKTDIGHGSPNKHGTADAHGTAVMGDEIEATRKHIGWAHAPFVVPAEAYEALDAKASGAEIEPPGTKVFASADPELKRRLAGELPANYADVVKSAVDAAIAVDKEVATRKAAQNALEKFGPALPEMIGGSADLTGSNLTNHKQSVAVDTEGNGNHVSYGVREFGMCHRQRHGAAWRRDPLRRHLPRVQRLRAQRRAHGRADEAARALYLHPRFNWRRRRRPDASAGGTRRLAAPDSRPQRMAPGRLAGERGGLRQRHRAQGWPTMLCLSRQNTAVIARDASHEALIRRGGYIVAETLKPALVPDRHRLRSRAGTGCTKRPWRRTASKPAWCQCPARNCSMRKALSTARQCFRRNCRSWLSKPVSPAAGGNMCTAGKRRARCSASIRLVNRRRPAC